MLQCSAKGVEPKPLQAIFLAEQKPRVSKQDHRRREIFEYQFQCRHESRERRKFFFVRVTVHIAAPRCSRDALGAESMPPSVCFDNPMNSGQRQFVFLRRLRWMSCLTHERKPTRSDPYIFRLCTYTVNLACYCLVMLNIHQRALSLVGMFVSGYNSCVHYRNAKLPLDTYIYTTCVLAEKRRGAKSTSIRPICFGASVGISSMSLAAYQ